MVTIAYALMCLIWGSTWVMIKLGLRGAPPMTAVAVRFIIAAIVVFFIIGLRGKRLPKTRHFLYLSLFLSLFHLALPYVLVYWGEQFISSGLTAVLFGTMPIVVAVLARLFLGDPLSARKLAGIVVGIAGVWTIFSDSVGFGGADAAAGMMAVLASVVCASLATVAAKKYAARYDPLITLSVPFAVSGLLVLAVAVPIESSNPFEYDFTTWFTVLYLAVLGSVAAFALYFWIIKRIDVTTLSYQTLIIPVLAVMIGWIFLNETVTIRLAVGTALILTGIALATAKSKRENISMKVGTR